MRRYLLMIFILFMLVACWGIARPLVLPGSTSTPVPATPTHTDPPPSPSATSTRVPTHINIPASPTATRTTTPQTATPTPYGGAFTVIYHPDDVLYVGDLVSIEVVSPAGLDLSEASLQVQVDPPTGPSLGPVKFAAWGIQGRQEATLLWAWDTQDQFACAYTLEFTVDPQGYTWSEQVTLLPEGDMPPDQAEAMWESTQTQCCTVFYITNTASDRDLGTLTAQIDEQARLAIDQMDAGFTQPITITVLPRVLGHGGFTSDEISVSYLDRNYAANSWEMVVHHEMIHAIDAHQGGDFRPTIFVEGLAVYLTGGHYKPESLMPRAAALLDGYLDYYIPLKALADEFYTSQHEIGYLEGGSLIEYMVKTYGWVAFDAFYRDIHLQQGQSQSDAIDAALQAHFSISLEQLESDYLAALRSLPEAADWVEDVRLTVTYYDTLRRYQQLLDPSAYFRTAWLLDNKAMRQRGIVADYLRHPNAPANLALESLFITASHQVTGLRFDAAAQTLEVINAVLDAIEQGHLEPFSISTLAADFYTISSVVQQVGYEPQSISLDGEAAEVDATSPSGLTLVELQLIRSAGGWSLLP